MLKYSILLFLFLGFVPVVKAVDRCTGVAAEVIDRYDDVFGTFIEFMDVSHAIRERAVNDLKVFRISDVFSGDNEVFLGFGIPNLYLVLPDAEGNGYRKFAAKSLKRAPAKYENTRGWAQSGVMLRFRDIPPETVTKLRELVMAQEGNRHWTCVNANCQVLSAAGFTAGEKPLDDIYLPYGFARQIMENGLQLNGENVEFDVIKTTPKPLTSFTMAVIKAELLTPKRHAVRFLKPWFERFGVSAVWAFSKGAAQQAVLMLRGTKRSEAEIRELDQMISRLPGDQQYVEDINITFSRPSQSAVLLRILWGNHALYEVSRPSVDINKYLPNVKKEFPDEDPSFFTRLKQKFLFSETVISFVRSKLIRSRRNLGTTNERKLHDQIPVHTEENPNMHNIVITGDRIIIARLHVRHKLVDWVLTKHVLISGYDKDVRFAGEVWKDPDGTIVLNRNSGTYKPTEAELQAALAYLREVFPNVPIRLSTAGP